MMGSAKERNRSRDVDEEDEIIPWKYVPHSAMQKLIKKLNPNATVSGNDWRMLANFLGYNSADINFIESDKDNNTKVLFKQYGTKSEASFNEVYIALAKMQRQDCLDILTEALPEIRQLYNQATESQIFHPAEAAGVFATGGHYPWSNPSCSCTYPPHPASVCGSHTYCPCSHGFGNSICPGHGHHHLGQPSYHGYPMPPLPCQSLGHPDTAPKSCLTSPCHTSPKEHNRIHRPIPSGYGYHDGNSSTSRMNLPANHVLGLHGQAGPSPGHAVYQVPPSYMYNDSAHNGNHIGTDSITSESFNNRHKVTRQYSDDCNTPLDSGNDKRFRNDGSRGILANLQGGACPGGSDRDGTEVGRPGNNHSPRFAHPSRAQHKQETIVKVENIPDSPNGNSMQSPANSGEPSWDRNGPSSTFPMRTKSKQERTLEDLNNLAISRRAASMPLNMKPVAYRKAFRHVKVFVTYSNDDNIHAKQVLSLCTFLQDNGFACCVDVREKENSGKSSKQLEWCARKIAEADFVLACISNKYLADIASDRQTCAVNSSEHYLHTRQIYELMVASQARGQPSSRGTTTTTTTTALSPCLTPLLFPGMTQEHVPQFLAGAPVYNWPEQYRDLAWFLTKPQERMKAKRPTQPARETEGGDLQQEDLRTAYKVAKAIIRNSLVSNGKENTQLTENVVPITNSPGVLLGEPENDHKWNAEVSLDQYGSSLNDFPPKSRTKIVGQNTQALSKNHLLMHQMNGTLYMDHHKNWQAALYVHGIRGKFR